MADDYTSRWDSSRRSRYMDEKAAKAVRLNAHRAGESVARDLDRIWRELAEAEIGLMDFLVSEDGPAALVAEFDEPNLGSLVERGLVQRPRGVGVNWMGAVRTSFRVAPAVRDRILTDAERYFGVDDDLRRQRRTSAAKLVLRR